MNKDGKTLLNYFRKKPWLFVLIWLGFLLNFYLIAKSGIFTQFLTNKNYPNYKSSIIEARVRNVASYSRGYPRVNLTDGRNILLELPNSGQKYIQANDSLSKRANTDSITVYRAYPTYTEVRVYGNGENYEPGDLDYKYSGLLKRYRIPNKPH